jgi:protein tyrosine phosphatase (PTP) superfamily phosphohydrolase (DUF442 family)
MTRKRRRIALAALLALVLPPGGYFAYRVSTGNVSQVVPGSVYRSAQLDGDSLRALIAEGRIKTVLNLRGPNIDQGWYKDEVRATLDREATQIDVPLASDHWLSRDQARTLVGILDTAERPLLIHCQFGAERTGLVSAMEELLRPGGSLASARSQFSVRYLFLPVQDGKVMVGHLDLYETWLAGQKLAHSPEAFRRWLLDEYEPPSPSREQWPHDPYPLKVVTQPSDLVRE